ncbi:MAG: TIGR04086 family membrane protein [Clostridia bacterium]|nr:TIGR04086 family membrane protein [Clostridia bacterium]
MEKENNEIVHIVKGVGISLISSLLLLIIFATILTFTNIPESVVSPVIIILTAISILFGSSITNMKIRKNGLLNGGIIGGIYMLTIYLISSILNWDFSLNLEALIFMVVGIAFGLLGGIIGVNKK